MKYSVEVTKGTAVYDIEAENEEEALNIADEWYNERHFQKPDIKPAVKEKPFDRLKALEAFNDKKENEKKLKLNAEKAKVEELKNKIISMKSRIETLLEVAYNCDTHCENFKSVLSEFGCSLSNGFWEPNVDYGYEVLRLVFTDYKECNRIALFWRNDSLSHNSSRFYYYPELEIGHSIGKFNINLGSGSDSLHIKNMEKFLNEYDNFEKNFYNAIDNIIKKG